MRNKKILVLNYVDNSDIIYKYINQFKPFRKESVNTYIKIYKIILNFPVKNNEFSNLNNIEIKSKEYYNIYLVDYNNIDTLNYTNNTYTGQQGLIILYDNTNLNHIINQLNKNYIFNYYVIYNDFNINSNWTFIYVQNKGYYFKYENLLTNEKILFLYYDSFSKDIYEYIHKCQNIREKGSYTFIDKNISILKYEHFRNIDDIKTKSLEYYNKLYNNISINNSLDENKEENKKVSSSGFQMNMTIYNISYKTIIDLLKSYPNITFYYVYKDNTINPN